MKNIKFHKEWCHFLLEMDESLKFDNTINMKNSLDAKLILSYQFGNVFKGLPNKLSTHLHLWEKYIIYGKHLFGGITNRDEQKKTKN